MPSFLRILAAAAILAFGAQAALSQSWTERPYNPPVGSLWSIVSETSTVETRAGGEQRTQQVKVRSELTIEEKLADGFRISYVNREMQVTGNTAVSGILNDAFGAMKGIVIRARTDASGKPVLVENLDEVKAALTALVDRMVERFQAKPQIGAFVRQMMNSMIMVDAKKAATSYLDEMPSLAVGQGNGLKPGDVRRENDEVQSPIGNIAFKSTLVTRLVSWDDRTGKARVVRKRETDPESLKTVVTMLARQLLNAADQGAQTPEMLEVMKQVKFSIESETRYDVEDGMTRAVDDRSTTTASAMGHTFRKDEHKTVAVTRLK